MLKKRRLKTWAKHFGFDAAIVATLAAILVALSDQFGPGVAFMVVALWRLGREIWQQIPQRRANLAGDWLRAAGDVASGWVGGGVMWWIL